jgi:hypothetical protein
MSSNITGLAMEDTIRIRHQIILQRHMDKQSTGMMQSNESCCGAYRLLSRGPQHSDAPQGGGMEESSFDTSSTWWHPSQVCESQISIQLLGSSDTQGRVLMRSCEGEV